MTDKSNAEVVADGIVSYLFDDYPDNNQMRWEATAEVATRIAAAQSNLAREVLSEIVGFQQGQGLEINKRLRALFSRLEISVDEGGSGGNQEAN